MHVYYHALTYYCALASVLVYNAEPILNVLMCALQVCFESKIQALLLQGKGPASRCLGSGDDSIMPQRLALGGL